MEWDPRITKTPVPKKEQREARVWQFIEMFGEILLASLGIVAGLLWLIAGLFNKND